MSALLYCIPTLRPGGAEQQLAMLTHLLPHYGWDMHVAFLDGGPFEERIGPAAVRHRIARRGNYDPRLVFRLARLIGRIRPAIVQTWLPQMDVVGGLAALARGVPWVISERSSAMAYRRDVWTALRTMLGRRAAGVIANSQAGVELWRRHGARRLHRIPNAIEVAESGERRARGTERPLVAYVGRLSPEKDLPTLIEAMGEVRRGADVRAVLCGDGPLMASLQAQVDAADLAGAVTLPGFVDDVQSILVQADVFVSISRFEGHPNAVLEAIASGTPVIVSDIAAHREFLDEQSALLVPAGDARAVAAAIDKTLRDPEAANGRAEAARRRIAGFAPASVAAAYDAYYRELLEER